MLWLAIAYPLLAHVAVLTGEPRWMWIALETLVIVSLFDALAKCRSPEEFVRTQSEFVRQQIGDYVESTRRIAEISLDMADEAADRAGRSVGQR